tara:strand:- start:1659 stop:1814 length:156 start_codon:yes stop_codon:yes gene_type:complete
VELDDGETIMKSAFIIKILPTDNKELIIKKLKKLIQRSGITIKKGGRHEKK